MDWRVLIAITVGTWGGYNVLLKWAGDKMSFAVSMFLFVLSYSIIVGAYCLCQGGLTAAEVFNRKALVPLAAGVLCAVGAVTFFKALPSAPGGLLMPLVSLYTVVAAVACIILFKEPVNVRVIAGIVCAAAAAFLLGMKNNP
jgi:drug/metabolite transporter (DMT)-like permease